jgi:hypothetical protein
MGDTGISQMGRRRRGSGIEGDVVGFRRYGGCKKVNLAFNAMMSFRENNLWEAREMKTD